MMLRFLIYDWLMIFTAIALWSLGVWKAVELIASL
jgi:hypothetical protein